jgi:mannosyl-oligosaccharide glucosidase
MFIIFRHWCDQNDGLLKYGWIAHDGRNFGTHDVYESVLNSYSIRTTWVKRNGGKDGGDWTVRNRFSSFSAEQTPIFASAIFYFSTDYTGWIKSAKKASPTSSIIIGETKDVGKFKINVEVTQTNPDEKFNSVYLDMANGNISVAVLKESLIHNRYFVMVKTKSEQIKEYIGFRKERHETLEDSNFIAIQISGFLPFEFEVMFESESLREELEKEKKPAPVELKGGEFDSNVAELHGRFSENFENTFKLREKNLSTSAVIMAQSAFSNLIGGVGYFSGKAIVKSLNNKEPVHYWPANLYTAVPSRSFFPRGFLWDEGIYFYF